MKRVSDSSWVRRPRGYHGNDAAPSLRAAVHGRVYVRELLPLRHRHNPLATTPRTPSVARRRPSEIAGFRFFFAAPAPSPGRGIADRELRPPSPPVHRPRAPFSYPCPHLTRAVAHGGGPRHRYRLLRARPRHNGRIIIARAARRHAAAADLSSARPSSHPFHTAVPRPGPTDPRAAAYRPADRPTAILLFRTAATTSKRTRTRARARTRFRDIINRRQSFVDRPRGRQQYRTDQNHRAANASRNRYDSYVATVFHCAARVTFGRSSARPKTPFCPANERTVRPVRRHYFSTRARHRIVSTHTHTHALTRRFLRLPNSLRSLFAFIPWSRAVPARCPIRLGPSTYSCSPNTRPFGHLKDSVCERRRRNFYSIRARFVIFRIYRSNFGSLLTHCRSSRIAFYSARYRAHLDVETYDARDSIHENRPANVTTHRPYETFFPKFRAPRSAFIHIYTYIYIYTRV